MNIFENCADNRKKILKVQHIDSNIYQNFENCANNKKKKF